MGNGRLPELWKQYQSGTTTPEMLRELLNDPDENIRVQAIRLLSDDWPLDTLFGPLAGVSYPHEPVTIERLLELAELDDSGLVLLALASTLQRLPLDQRVELATRLVERQEFALDAHLPSMIWYGLMPVAESSPGALMPAMID